jgi:hypothetical protein
MCFGLIHTYMLFARDVYLVETHFLSYNYHCDVIANWITLNYVHELLFVLPLLVY